MDNLRLQFKSALRAVIARSYLADNCSLVVRLAMMMIDVEQAVLQQLLALRKLPDALMDLYDHQVFKGFVQDTLGQLQRIRIRAREGHEFFLAHRNPGRALRGGGKGRTTPPLGIDLSRVPNPSCFLDEGNQKWQQCGLQLAYLIQLDGEDHYCSCNPFPFGQFHATIATSRHTSQRWSDENDLRHVLLSLLDLAAQLKGWVVLYNGSRTAGASIPAHRHYQVFKIQPAQDPFPLQQAARAKAKRIGASTALPLVGGEDYPMTCFRLSGTREEIRSNAVQLASRWQSLDPTFSENLIVLNEDDGVCLYYCSSGPILACRWLQWCHCLPGDTRRIHLLG